MVLLNTFKLKHLPNKLTRYSSMNVVTPRIIIVVQVFESHETKKIHFEAKHKVSSCSCQSWHTLHIFIANCPAYSQIDISQAPTSTSVCMFEHDALRTHWIMFDLLSVILLIMHQSFETPGPPTSGLSGAFTFYASESK